LQAKTQTLKMTIVSGYRFGVSTKTIAKWKSRDFVKDKTSRPKTIHYALNETEREIIRVVRTLTWSIVSGLRIIDSNAQTGITWWNWTSYRDYLKAKSIGNP
jgi:hypothetical protein